MIGVGFSRRARSAAPDPEVGMLDVSANALAVLILATMLVISAAAPPVVRGEVRRDDTPSLFYPSPIDAVLAPHSRYVLILEEGAVELDVDAFAAQLATGQVTARTGQGEMTLVTDRTSYRDLNDYRATLMPDWPALAEIAVPMQDETDIGAEVELASRLFDRSGVATTYFVSVEAVATFPTLYWNLREAQVPIRWSTVPTGQKIAFERRVNGFERPQRQWQ